MSVVLKEQFNPEIFKQLGNNGTLPGGGITWMKKKSDQDR
jgi:hypothetical protein